MTSNGNNPYYTSIFRTSHGSLYRKTEPISDILKNRHRYRRRYLKNRKYRKTDEKNENIGYFGISEATVAVLHNALKNVVELIKCNA